MVAGEADLVAGPACVQLAAMKLQQGPGEGDHRQLLRLASPTGGGVEVRLRLRKPAEVEAYVAAVVERGRQMRIEPHGLVEQGVGHLAVAGLVDDHAERDPQPPLMRMGQDSGAQELHGLSTPAEIGQRAGAAVDPFQPMRRKRRHLLPQRKRLLGHVEPAGDPRQSGQYVHIVGRLGLGFLIGLDRVGQLADRLAPAPSVCWLFRISLQSVRPVGHGDPRRRPRPSWEK